MGPQNSRLAVFLIPCLWLLPHFGFAQYVNNVPEAFKALSTTPEVIVLDNPLDVPTDNGHFQGVQVIAKNDSKKLLISGSSQTTAYFLQVDLTTQKTDTLIPLMREPYRHAGGIQVSAPYVVVGIEDNIIKTASKVCLYNYNEGNLYTGQPFMRIERQGEVERYTAGATGLLAMKGGYLLVVGNWDSRHWDFYHIEPETGAKQMLTSFAAPADWPGYQSINLISDNTGIYAIGTYQKEDVGLADLILVSKRDTFTPIIEKMMTKEFNCTNGVDFSGAAGIQVDSQGKLNLWGTQKNTARQIRVNRFSEP